MAAPVVGHPGAETLDSPSPETLACGPEVQITEPIHPIDSLDPNFLFSQGLIGPRCAASVLVDGVPCESIMDSGSQVTTISEFFHKMHLSHLPIQPIHALLEIEGAGGQNVPYLGYVQTCITFPENIAGKEQQLAVLVLVVPECHFNSRIPLLIGTNVLLRVYGQLVHQDGPKFIHKLHFKQLATILQHVAQVQRNDTHSCPVMLHSKGAVTIPARHKQCLMGNVRLRKNNRNTSFVLEPHEQYKLPGGLLLESALVAIPFNSSSKVPVIVHNVSEHAVTLQSNSIVAQACAAQHVSPLASSQTRNPPSQNEPDSDNLTFNLDDSPIPEQWKERILGN